MDSNVPHDNYILAYILYILFHRLRQEAEDAMKKKVERLPKSCCLDKFDSDLADAVDPPSRHARKGNAVDVSLVYPVGQQPPNQIPLFSKALLKKLDYMYREEFVAYIFDETKMSMEQRKALLQAEKYRRKTFSASWPHGKNSTLSRTRMAQAGFYFSGGTDHVSCAFCPMDALHGWIADDNPMTEHDRAYSDCNFVVDRENCGNIVFNVPVTPHDSRLLYGDIASDQFTILDSELRTDSHRYTDSPMPGQARELLGIATDLLASVVEYAPNATRMLTFARWPHENPVKAEQLCEAGFYYTGEGDLVRCFFCSGGIRFWAQNADPWEEHARWHPTCSFLRLMMGVEFVEGVKMTRPGLCTKKIDYTNYMCEVCENLGHGKEVIRMAFVRNGNRPFDAIQDMIDAIYDIEEEGVTPTMEQSEHAQIQAPHQAEPIPPTQEQNNEEEKGKVLNLGECVSCSEMLHISVSAGYVALPCGHLIWCDSCNTRFCKLGANVVCPRNDCKVPLKGTIKVFFA